MDLLPEFIKTLLSNVPDTHQVPTKYLEEFEKEVDNLEEVIKRAESGEKEGRTYGMSLAGNSGVVWNNINEAHHLHHVGETAEITTHTTQSEEDKVNEPENDQLLENTLKPKEESTTDIYAIDERFGDLEKRPTDKTTETTFTFVKDDVVHERQGRTYGMSLAGDSGTVWNDLDDTRYAYHVGEPEALTSTTTAKEEKLEPEVVSIPETTQRPTEGTTINSINYFEEDYIKLDSEEIEASMKDIDHIFEEMVKNSTEKPEATTESSKLSEDPASKFTESTKEISNMTTERDTSKKILSTPKPDRVTEKPGLSGNVVDEEKPTDDEKGSNDRKDKSKNPSNNKDEKSKQQAFAQELIKNKYFWDWVQDSSKAYLEILMKKVDALISAEVEKQIKLYFEAHKDIGNCATGLSTNNSTAEVNQIETNFKDIDDQVNHTDDTEIDSHNNNSVDQPININSNTTEDNNKLISKKHKETEAKKSDPAVKIEAENVYGNSVGNAKVTNIFIFSISNSSDLNKIKPLYNGTNDIHVFGTPNDVQKPTVDNTEEMPEVLGVTTEKVGTEIPDAGTTEKVDLSTENTDVSATEKVVTIPDIVSSTQNTDTTTEKVTLSTVEQIEVNYTENKNVTTSEQMANTSERPQAITIENVDTDLSASDKQDETTEKITITTEMLTDSTEKVDLSTTNEDSEISSEQTTISSEKPITASATENDPSTNEKVDVINIEAESTTPKETVPDAND